MHTTNYEATLITVAADCPAQGSVVPDKAGSIAALQYAMLAASPYAHTSDDVLFSVFATRKGIAEADLPAARTAFFAKPQACLRASPLVKSFGWALHHDSQGRVALVDQQSEQYATLAEDEATTKRPGMRSKRA